MKRHQRKFQFKKWGKAIAFLGLVATVGFSANFFIHQQTRTTSKASFSASTLQILQNETAIDSAHPLKLSVNSSSTSSALIVSRLEQGAFVVKTNQLDCDPLQVNCDPERYEIQIPVIEKHIFGTGMQLSVNQAEVSDFLDVDFGFGHCYSTGGGRTLESWASGACRMRTPILVFPEHNLLITYAQPYPKILRLTRDGKFGCPTGSTCVVMKLKPGDKNASPAPLIVIKKNSMDEVYAAYRQIRLQLGYSDKQPTYSVFGSNWEVYNELACSANKTSTTNALNRLYGYGFPISTVTVGSGYWDGDNWPGCGTVVNSTPTTDMLEISQTRWGGLGGFTDFINFLKSHNSIPIIGMRHRISPKLGTSDASETNVDRIKTLFNQKNYNSNMLISADSNNMSTRWKFQNENANESFYLLKNEPAAISVWTKLISEKYGAIGGIKHDDMTIHSQKGFLKNQNAVNLPDDYYNPILDTYTNNKGKDYIILTRDTWLAMKGDAIVPDWLMETNPNYYPPSSTKVYGQKYQFDNAITTAMSGYPTVQNNTLVFDYCPGSLSDCSGKDIASDKKLNFLRTNQLAVFQGVTMFSRGFWHVQDPSMENALKWYGQLRARLQQYAYDQAMGSFETGTLRSLRPLFFDYPSDSEVYKQYVQLDTVNDQNNPRNQFMFGNALMIRPVFSDATAVKVYLPKGIWKPFLKKAEAYDQSKGGAYVTYTLGGEISSHIDFPVFVKANEILVIGESGSPSSPMAYVYFHSPSQTSSIYTYHAKNGSTQRLQASTDANQATVITNLTNGKSVSMTKDKFSKNFFLASLKTILN